MVEAPSRLPTSSDKKLGIAYLAWAFGLHYAYLEEWGMLALFWLTAWGLGIWWLVDAVRLPELVRMRNTGIRLR